MRRLAEAEQRLTPCEPQEIIMQLMPTLALVGASGLTQSDREEWLAAATDALKDVPADLLKGAISRARLNCDHPSKVIPFITRDVANGWNWRRKHLAEVREDTARHSALPAPGQTYCTAEEARAIVDEVFPQARELAPVKSAHVPIAADYIALGHSPEAAAKIMGQFHKLDERQVGRLVSKATEWSQ
jgi:hypothetical protein